MPKNFFDLTFFNAGEFDVVIDAPLNDSDTVSTVAITGATGVGATIYHNVFVSLEVGDTREIAFATAVGNGSMTIERGDTEFGYAKHAWASGTVVNAYLPKQVLQSLQYSAGFGGGDVPVTTVTALPYSTPVEYTVLPGMQILKVAYVNSSTSSDPTGANGSIYATNVTPVVKLVVPTGYRYTAQIIVVNDFLGPIIITSSDNTTSPKAVGSGANQYNTFALYYSVGYKQVSRINMTALNVTMTSQDTHTSDTQYDHLYKANIEGVMVLWEASQVTQMLDMPYYTRPNELGINDTSPHEIIDHPSKVALAIVKRLGGSLNQELTVPTYFQSNYHPATIGEWIGWASSWMDSMNSSYPP